ncbi:MAG: precorrin-6A reductase [Lachnospiraceae bacterium]|nr:precorrin-6A reductase [Lachnospiraceae bacterium]
MYDIILFGGTEEGRILAEHLQQMKALRCCVCVTTEYGERLLPQREGLDILRGQLKADAMEVLFKKEQPRLVIDATHPYAAHISATIERICGELSIERLRVLRPESEIGDCRSFQTMEELTAWLNTNEKTVFASTGAKEGAALTEVRDFEKRVWLRILPSPEPLRAMLDLGYPAAHLICMQGPFSESLNREMFRAAGAEVLVTKESGRAGGFQEKVAAAKALQMEVCVLRRPVTEEQGVPLAAALERIRKEEHRI